MLAINPRTTIQEILLEPFFDVVELRHRNSGDHCRFTMVVFVDEYHIEVLQLKLNSLKMNQLNLVQGDDKRRLHTIVNNIKKNRPKYGHNMEDCLECSILEGSQPA